METKCRDVDMEFLILEAGLGSGGWEPKRPWPGSGGNWEKRRKQCWGWGVAGANLEAGRLSPEDLGWLGSLLWAGEARARPTWSLSLRPWHPVADRWSALVPQLERFNSSRLNLETLANLENGSKMGGER